jgi:hypothetical protein
MVIEATASSAGRQTAGIAESTRNVIGDNPFALSEDEDDDDDDDLVKAERSALVGRANLH